MPQVIRTQGLNNLIDVGAYNAFQQSFRMYEPQDINNELATIVPVAGRSEARLPFLWYPPRARAWVGERFRGALDGGMLTIPVELYESTVAVPRTVVEDQMVRMIELRAGELATEYFRFLHERFVLVLANGTATNTFDGQPLLTSSPAARGSQNVNLSNLPLSPENLAAGIAAMGRYTDPEGRPLGMRPTHLLVGPALEFQARQIVSSTNLFPSGGTDRTIGTANPLYNQLQVIVTPYITDNDWYLIAAGSNSFRPVIRVDRTDVPLEFIAKTSASDDNVYARDSYEWGIRFRHGFGPGAWFAVYSGQPS